MEAIQLKSMIYYDREDKKEKYSYKMVECDKPSDVKYEDGMYSFKFIKYFPITIAGEDYYVVVDKSKETYAFGKSMTVQELLTQDWVSQEDKDALISLSKDSSFKTYYVTGRKNLLLDYFDNKVSDDVVYEKTPDIEIADERLISSRIEWYVEYEKNGKMVCEPTFCSDKKFRSDLVGVEYRFVKVAVFEINGIKYERIVERENLVHRNSESYTQSEVDRALDGAKRILYGYNNDDSPMFAGYTRIYPFNTEDSASVFRMQEENIANNDVLTVTGSGDALLDLFMYGADKVTCFDINRLAKFYAILKFCFIKAGMNYEEYKKFFMGNGGIILEQEIYEKYKSYLSRDVRKFWDEIYQYLIDNNLQLKNSEHNLFYKIYDFFSNANSSYENKSSYFNESNYGRLQSILEGKSLEDVRFVDASLFDVPEILDGEYYDYAYLSNIMDFTDLYFDNKELAERLELFKQFILVNFRRIVREDGSIDVGFISHYWHNDEDRVEYSEVFSPEEGFRLKDLIPYNRSDKVLTYSSKRKMIDIEGSFKM